MKLFEVGKVGLYLDTITHGTELRREEEVKIVSLVLRVQPFDAQLAAAMHDGVKPVLFSLTTGEPKDLLKRVDFALGTTRQNLLVYASPDTGNPSIAFMQAKIGSIYARTEKGVKGFGLVVKVSFGPLGRAELEYVQDWHLSQRFVSFEEAEPGMLEDVDEDPLDPPMGLAADGPNLAPMFDDQGNALVDASNRPLHSHQSKRGKKRTPAALLDEPVDGAAIAE